MQALPNHTKWRRRVSVCVCVCVCAHVHVTIESSRGVKTEIYEAKPAQAIISYITTLTYQMTICARGAGCRLRAEHVFIYFGWAFARDWDCSTCAEKKRMPELPAERGGEGRKREKRKASSETKRKMNGKEWRQESKLFISEIRKYWTNNRYWIVSISFSFLPNCISLGPAPSTRLTMSCSVSAYLHLLCRISSNLYSRHRQADRHQPAKEP